MAKGITEATVEEIKARVDLADLIASYGVAVKAAGASKKACCPFHHEKTPSFNINESKGFYHCFGCGESGDAIKFVQKMEGLSFVEAVRKLAEQCGIKLETQEDPEAGRRQRLYGLVAELAQFYHRCLKKTKEAELARAYLKERELDEATVDDWLIGYAPNGVAVILKWAEKYHYTPAELEAAGVIKAPNRPGDRGYHRFSGRLMFAIRDKRGRVVGFSGRQLVASKNSGKYVNSPETPIFKKSNLLFGFDRAAGAITQAAHREAIVCEGQIDCIRLHQCGFTNAVAGQGTAFTESHAQMLGKVADQVTLVYDDDGAGHKATIKSARLCLAVALPVRTVSLPNGDDPDSFLRTHPPAEFRAMLEGARSIMEFQVRSARAEEANPDSIDAVNRITREVLTTVAASSSAVLRAGMVGEAAKLLKLPVAALTEELGRLSVGARAARPPAPAATEPGELADEPPTAVDEPPRFSAAVEPPPPGEMALMEFLMANEGESNLDGIVGEFLPPPVFAHDFTRRFVEVWRSSLATGDDQFGAFAEQLEIAERTWFDAVLLGGAKAQASALSPVEILEDFVRTLWVAKLRRVRGELPAAGDAEAEARRLRISMDLKRLPRVKWHAVKDRIREYVKGEY